MGMQVILYGTYKTILYGLLGLPGGSDGKESTCNVEDLSSIPGLGRSPGGGHGNPLQDSCLHNSHGQRILVSYSAEVQPRLIQGVRRGDGFGDKDTIALIKY